MLVLLPPSEGKARPEAGRPLDLDRLSSPALTAHRRAVLAALVEVSARDDALEVLGAGRSLAAEVRHNVDLEHAPTAPAREVYTGVLYAAAGLASLDGSAAALAERTVRTVSALLGVVTPGDPVPAYRLSMGTDLPGVGPLATSWRPHLAAVLDAEAEGRLVVDCRSAAYAAAWSPPASAAGHVVVKVLRDVDGRRVVVSHWAKQSRGALTRHLLTRPGSVPGSPAELLDATLELVGTGPIGCTAPGLMTNELVTAELSTPRRGPAVLSLVVA
ncbi:peroxide stress protein YaaA [Actinotalea sp. AC32]|nr:peroxide stress protein YaaA [Actinotalea sp. AC32]